jgi:hypothetical protein
MAKKVSIKITAKEKALAEHYIYGILAAGYAAHTISPHDSFKQVAIKAVVGGLVAPILARINPKSLVNQIDEATGLSSEVTAPIVTTAIADVNKLVTQETPTTK